MLCVAHLMLVMLRLTPFGAHLMLVMVLNLPEQCSFQDLLFHMLFMPKSAEKSASRMDLSLLQTGNLCRFSWLGICIDFVRLLLFRVQRRGGRALNDFYCFECRGRGGRALNDVYCFESRGEGGRALNDFYCFESRGGEGVGLEMTIIVSKAEEEG